jgi:transposase InsO family protein
VTPTPCERALTHHSDATPRPTRPSWRGLGGTIHSITACVLRRPVEPGQYTCEDYTQTLDDHDVLASLGSTGDCYDNALAESFVDSFKTELIADRVWRTHDQAELAIAKWVGWYNHRRLHSALGDIAPAEYEQPHAPAAATTPISPTNLLPIAA